PTSGTSDDILLRRAEDLRARNPNPNGSNAGITPGLSKNDYVLKTYAIRHADAIDVQSYLLRALAYEGGIVEVMGRCGVKHDDGEPVQFVFVTAPTFMIPGIDETIARIDVPGFAFHDGTGNANANGQSAATQYVGKHRTAGELKSILIGTELGNVGQFYVAPFADNALNTIYMSENPADIADDLAALELFDRPPLQAEFELAIYEVDAETGSDLGLDWEAWKRSLSGSFVFTDVGGDGRGSDFDALVGLDAAVVADFLNYLVRDGKAEVVTETTLLSINAEDNPGQLSGGAKGQATASPATFRAVRTVPFAPIESPTGDLADRRVVDSATDERVIEGIELEILPFIATASITADVRVRVTSVVDLATDARTPVVATSATRSVVNLAPNRTVVLGTFERTRLLEETNRVFLLGELPWLGGLFEREVTVTRRSRVVVLVTPRLRDGSEDLNGRARVPPMLGERQG
ncbi:MAG: hypothetical protein IT459_11290, partial [Planctomycetes bacterium]|nr:hypothetical protein [Planctomycetota bacterium]